MMTTPAPSPASAAPAASANTSAACAATASTLARQLSRLFALPDHPVQPASDGDGHFRAAQPGGRSRCLRLGFPRLTDWALPGRLCQQAQEVWSLPQSALPALSVSPQGGFELWFSLATALPQAELAALGEWLRRTTLPAEAQESAVVRAAGEALDLPPGLDAVSRRWSAFIDPTLAGMFAEEAGLDFPPNAERQAEMLAGLTPLSEEVLALWRHEQEQEQKQTPLPEAASPAAVSRRYTDPREFLLEVMNDEAAGLAERIRAAEVLLVNAPERSPQQQP